MSWQDLRAAFDELVELPPDERQRRLVRIAAADAELAARLARLLAEDESAGAFLERPPQPAGVARVPVVGSTGLRLGRYELVRPIGSGGMGAVWEAHQHEPDRRVALKLVARTSASAADRWRFQHEVQVLANLNHPAIATFYEAGETLLGERPVAWLAMELVEGATDIVARTRAQPLDRAACIDLFLNLCDAVDHGHRRGVLHRDLKPSNILVDQDGALKLIDFGIARALAPDGGEAQRTATGEILGTLQYMSPEQLAGDSRRIGTWSDVYALGVVLYELLCGRPPIAVDGLPLAAVADAVMRREPVPPRQACPDLPTDLGLILLRALDKEPQRRYPTAQHLAQDLRRCLAHEPVEARPPSAGYRLRKYVRRHRLVVGAAAVVFVSAGAAVTGTGLALVRTQRAEANERAGRETAEASLDFLVDVLSSPDPSKRGRTTTMVDALTKAARDFGARFADKVAARAVIGRAIGRTFAGLGMLPEAEQHLRASADDARVAYGDTHPTTIRAELDLGHAILQRGRLDEAETLVRAAAARVTALPTDHELRDVADFGLGDLLRARGDRTGAVAILRPVVARLRARAPADGFTLQVTNLLAGTLHELGDIDAAEQLYVAAHAGLVAAVGAEHPDAICTLSNLSMVLQSHGRFEQALPIVEQVVDLRRRVLGADHIDTAATLVNAGGILIRLGRFDQAAERLDEALAVLSRTVQENEPALQVALSNLAVLERDRSNFARSIELGERLLAIRRKTRGESHRETLVTMITLADTHRRAGDTKQALAMLQQAHRIAVNAEPAVPTVVYQCELAEGWCHAELREYDAAERCFLRCLETFDAAENASPNKGTMWRADPDLVALYRLTDRPELAAKYASEFSRAREPDMGLRRK